jgi:hypothetical protein
MEKADFRCVGRFVALCVPAVLAVFCGFAALAFFLFFEYEYFL